MFSLRNKRKISLNYLQYPLLSGALYSDLENKVKVSITYYGLELATEVCTYKH